MKTELYDKNGREIQIGDKYTTNNIGDIYTVFWKGGAICGGMCYDDAEPLIQESTESGDLFMDENLDWMEIVTTNEDLFSNVIQQKMKKLIKYFKAKISNFKYNWSYLGVLDSPFVGLELKWYFGKIMYGTPYFLPRRWVKCTFEDGVEAWDEMNVNSQEAYLTINQYQNMQYNLQILQEEKI